MPTREETTARAAADVEDVHVPGPVRVRRGSKGPKKAKAAAPAPAFKPPAKAKGPRLRAARGLRMRIGSDGTIDVRHSTDGGAAVDAARLLHGEGVALDAAAAEVLLDDAPPRPVWIQVAKLGSFAGHTAGPFRIDEQTLGDIVRNFRATSNRRVPIDFEHASEAEATAGSVPTKGAPAQGWIIDLESRGQGGLWGLVEWGEPARTYIREGKYRFISPAIRFNSRDRVTDAGIGARLTSAGLTNQPFLDGMAPLAARDAAADGAGDTTMTDHPMMGAHEFMPRMRAALRLGELATAAECKDQLGRLRAMCQMADDPYGTHEGVNLGDYMLPLRGLMNLSANATIGDLFDAVEEMIEAAIQRHELAMHGETEDGPESADMADREGQVETTSAATAPSEETTAMADTSEMQKKIDGLEADKTALAARATELELKLKASEAEAARLLSESEARETADIERDVTAAIECHGKTKGITLADKDALVTFRKASPEGFRKLYPALGPAAALLTARLTTRGGEPPAVREAQSARKEISVAMLSDKTSEFVAKGMTREDAVVEARRVLLAAS